MHCDFQATSKIQRGLRRWECSRCGGYQLGERPGLAWCRASPSRGAGDTLRKMTAALKLPHCGGCEERQTILNRWFPYSRNPGNPKAAMHAPNPQALVPLLTVGITAFERPEHLTRCVQSLRVWYPHVRVIVADNGTQRADLSQVNGIELVELPFDCGLSAARNALAARCQTPYLLIAEDDFVFTPRARLELLVDVLEHDAELALAGGSIVEGGLAKSAAFDYLLENASGAGITTLRGLPAAGPLEATRAGTRYRRCHKVANFFVARAAALRAYPWPEELKVWEHAAWFWVLCDAGARVAHVPDVSIEHDRDGRSEHYKAYRNRSIAAHHQWFGARGLRYQQARSPQWRVDPSELHSPDTGARPNVVVLGVGHSGTSVLVRMLGALDWTLEGLDEEYSEPPAVRRLNWIARKTGKLSAVAWQSLPSAGPWVVKDPRFIWTLHLWHEHFQRVTHPPLLVWITRDDEAVAGSYLRRNHFGGDRDVALAQIAQRRQLAADQFARWPAGWPKVHVDYEQLRAAVQLFDPARG